MITRPLQTEAFTLVEVAIAIAIVSFVLVVLMGLLTSGMVSSRRSSDETHLAALISSVASQLRSAGSVATTNYYFDSNGTPTTNATASYYTCAILKTNFVASTPPLPSGATNSAQMAQVNFTYPPSVAKPQTTTIYVVLP